jgi:hypothetical protein
VIGDWTERNRERVKYVVPAYVHADAIPRDPRLRSRRGHSDLLTGCTHGVNEAAAWAVPVVLGVGLLVGLSNGIGVVMLGAPPIVVTLAANGLLQGLTLIYCNGSPQSSALSAVSESTNGRRGLPSIAAWIVPAFLAFALLLLHRTPVRQRVYPQALDGCHTLPDPGARTGEHRNESSGIGVQPEARHENTWGYLVKVLRFTSSTDDSDLFFRLLRAS